MKLKNPTEQIFDAVRQLQQTELKFPEENPYEDAISNKRLAKRLDMLENEVYSLILARLDRIEARLTDLEDLTR